MKYRSCHVATACICYSLPPTVTSATSQQLQVTFADPFFQCSSILCLSVQALILGQLIFIFTVSLQFFLTYSTLNLSFL